MKKLRFWQRGIVALLIFALSVFGGVFTYSYMLGNPVSAATSQDVTVNATPEYISISNAPSTFDFGIVAESSTNDTGNDHFTVTNGSSVNIDISINSSAWDAGAGSAWTYNDPASDTGNFDASSGEGGVGGSTGSGNYDISVPNGAGALLCDNVTAVTDPQWELQLDAPTAFTHADEQEAIVTLLATAE